MSISAGGIVATDSGNHTETNAVALIGHGDDDAVAINGVGCKAIAHHHRALYEGTRFGEIHDEFDISKLRYNKFIIMTDADVDGAHIDTLMLTFLYRFRPELIKQGHVYLAMPPLYKLEKNKKVWYAYSDDELNKILNDVGRDQNNRIQRYKGLGEMNPEQLWETTMNPETRILKKVVINEETESEVDLTFNILMGDKVEPRREFIEENAKFVQNLDI
jgi:DNA gyrase subunit B